MRKLSSVFMALFLTLLPLAGTPVRAQQNPPSNQSFVGGRYVARNYVYPGVRINSGNNNAGAATINLSAGSVRLQDGRTIVPFSAGGFNIQGQPGSFPAIPITVGAGTTKETVTPTAVSGCYVGAPQGNCQITATFANAHGQGEIVTSGSAGIQEAINDAAYFGGGLVEVDGSLNFVYGGPATVTAALAAAIVMPAVSIEDTHLGTPQYWNPTGGTATLAAPTTLIATTAGFGVAGANFTGGNYTGSSTYITCIAYVDIMGQEGPCSATFTISTSGSATTDQIGYTAPAASTGAVGYTIYITLASGAYSNSYKVPLATYATGVATGNGVCTLTTVETTTAACALTNAPYGQTGSMAIVSALTVNTSSVNPQSTVVSTTSLYVPNAGGRTTYIYVPSSRVGIPGVPATFTPFTISAAAGTTAPTVLGMVNLPANLLNLVGRTVEICGYATTTASTATIEDIQIQWDARGQNTTGVGVKVSDTSATVTASTTLQINFCAQLQGTVTSAASVTGGSAQALAGYQVSSIAALSAAAAGGETIKGSTASLNLFEEARINIIYLHTTGTEGTALTLQGLTIRAI